MKILAAGLANRDLLGWYPPEPAKTCLQVLLSQDQVGVPASFLLQQQLKVSRAQPTTSQLFSLVDTSLVSFGHLKGSFHCQISLSE